MNDYQNLSETELLSVIEKAEIALKNKQANKRKEVIAKIKELAASIDLNIEITDPANKPLKSAKLPPKYRHPHDPEKTWTGRGITPRWIRELTDKGHDLSEFKV